LRFPNGEIRRFEALDVFDAETGLLKREKKKKRQKRSD
jgi:hypothetical protein